MSAATQQAPTQDRPRRRLSIVPRSRKGRIAVAVVAMLAVAGTAVALYIFRLGISGNVAANDFVVRWAAGSVTTVPSTGGTCTASVLSDTELSIAASGWYPGDSCTVNAKAEAGLASAEDGRVIGVTTTGTYPTGWSVELGAGVCGAVLNSSGTTTTPLVVSIDPAEQNPGSGALPSDLALEVVPESQYNPALCS